MATTISISIAGIEGKRTFANDTKTSPVLLLYADSKGVDPAATNKQKLQFIVDQLVDEIVREAKRLAAHNFDNAQLAERIAIEEALSLE